MLQTCIDFIIHCCNFYHNYVCDVVVVMFIGWNFFQLRKKKQKKTGHLAYKIAALNDTKKKCNIKGNNNIIKKGK